MHQQIPSIDQCGIPPQMPQPIVLCPIQLLYDTQTHTPMVVQHNEEHIQRPHPMLLNIQNTPPWIQNQTQNVIYVQQTPNQMLPYLQPSMIQNPIFQTPFNFPQILPQESIRPVMQIPTLIQKEIVQNQPANLNYPGAPTVHENMTQNLMANTNSNVAIEKMPLVAQNQAKAALKSEMIQLNQLNATVTETMPVIAQNEVNTTANAEIFPFRAQNQKKLKENMPVLTHLLNQTPVDYENKPVMQNQQVQTDFPLFKTAKRGPQNASINNTPQNNEKTDEIPQSNPIDTRQHHIRQIRPHISKKTEFPLHMRSKVQETINVRNIYRPILPKPVGRPYEFIGPNFVNPNFVTLRAPDPTQPMAIPNCGVITNRTTITEDINTLSVNYNNNKTTEIHNITSMSGGTIINSNITNIKDINTQENATIIENTVVQPTEKVAENKLNLITIEEICIEEYEVKEFVKKKEVQIKNKDDKVNPQPDLKPMIQSYIDEVQIRTKEKSENVGHENKKDNNLDKKVSAVNRSQERKITKNGIFILTHVLDGHVIQESNVAFPIQKPLRERITYEPYVTPNCKNDVEPTLPLKYRHVIDSKKQDVENSVVQETKEDNENPFLNLLKATVEAWNTDQLSSHLTKHNWKETAIKLKDQEIDGESLFLVSEQQLLYIGVCEKHAGLINEFITKCADV